MAALPVIANVYRTTWRWAGPGGLTAQSVLHFRATGGGTAATLWTALDANASLNMIQHAPNSVSVTRVDIIKLDGLAATVQNPTGSPAKWTGNGVGEAIPAQACLLKMTTGQRGPSKRGRIFLPFVQEGVQNAGTMTGAVATNMQTAWRTWQTAMIAAGFQPCVASYVHAVATDPVVLTIETLCSTVGQRMQRLRR